MKRGDLCIPGVGSMAALTLASLRVAQENPAPLIALTAKPEGLSESDKAALKKAAEKRERKAAIRRALASQNGPNTEDGDTPTTD